MDLPILRGLTGRRSIVTNSGARTMNWQQKETTTSLLTVSMTTTLESVQRSFGLDGRLQKVR